MEYNKRNVMVIEDETCLENTEEGHLMDETKRRVNEEVRNLIDRK